MERISFEAGDCCIYSEPAIQYFRDEHWHQL
jgi:hypothetical protein